MLTVTQGDAQPVPTEPNSAILGKLLVAAILLAPLAVMLFPELNHRSGNNTPKVRQAAPAARSLAKDPLVDSCSIRPSDR